MGLLQGGIVERLCRIAFALPFYRLLFLVLLQLPDEVPNGLDYLSAVSVGLVGSMGDYLRSSCFCFCTKENFAPQKPRHCGGVRRDNSAAIALSACSALPIRPTRIVLHLPLYRLLVGNVPPRPQVRQLGTELTIGRSFSYINSDVMKQRRNIVFFRASAQLVQLPCMGERLIKGKKRLAFLVCKP